MPLQKNQVLTLQVERLSSDGSGVAHSPEGETVFIPGAAPGDEARVRIVKDCKRYAFGIWTMPPSSAPSRRMLQTPLHASAGWMFRSFPS